MKPANKIICTASAAICLFLPIGAAAQTTTSSTEALKTIGDFAERLCQTVPLDTKSEKIELTGSAKAELEGIVKKLANLGVSGAAKYDSASSKNVLQKDLAEVLKDSRNCRLQVWNDLKGKFEVGTVTPPKACRDKSHGVERYTREFEVTRSSHLMGGGFNQPRWCADALAQLRTEFTVAEFQQLRSSENTTNTCSPFNCPQYQYHCTFKVKADPIFVEKQSSACK